MSVALTPAVLLLTLAAQILSGFVGAATAVCIGEQGARLEVQILGSDGCGCHGEHHCHHHGDEAAHEHSGRKGAGRKQGRSSFAEPSERNDRSCSSGCVVELSECRHAHSCSCAHVALPSDKPTLEERKLKKPVPTEVFRSASSLRVCPLGQGSRSVASFSRAPPGRTVLSQLSTLYLLL